MNSETLATEILHELKTSSKRWFIAFITVLMLWFATIGAFLWYISLPVEEYDIVQDSTDRSFNIVGGDYNGIQAESELQEESN